MSLTTQERTGDHRTVVNLVGSSPAMRRLHHEISCMARTPFIVLIEGESGSGKELVAHRIHAESARGQGPFIGVNCAALVDSLLEAELFGIEDRTATGVRGRRGKFELAHGGTLFLDRPQQLSVLRRARQRGRTSAWAIGSSADTGRCF